MENPHWQIGIFGTFDVQNYGDLLFPIIAEAELEERLGAVTLHRFSYHAKTLPHWPYKVTSVAELPQMAANLDGILIGGGFLIRFDKKVAPAYKPPAPTIHHPTGYWLTPALIALQHNIPVVWNAPGMHCNEIPDWADPLMEMAFSLSSYIAVRDEPSRTALSRFANTDKVTVVPDTAFGLARLLDKRLSSEFDRLREAAGLTKPYIVIQAALGLDRFLSFVKKHADLLQDYQFLALPIGPVLGDHERILDSDLPGLARLPVWPHPLLLAEVISKSAAVVGYSYHLAITALTSGVPVFTPIDLSTGKYSALLAYERIFPLPEDGVSEPEQFVSRLGKTAPCQAVQVARDQSAHHWDQVAAVIKAGDTATRPALNRFWQSLPDLLETAADQYEELCQQAGKPSARGKTLVNAALDAESAEKQKRIDELGKLLALARAEIVARDDRIAALYNSSSMKITAPLRVLLDRLKRLVGKK